MKENYKPQVEFVELLEREEEKAYR